MSEPTARTPSIAAELTATEIAPTLADSEGVPINSAAFVRFNAPLNKTLLAHMEFGIKGTSGTVTYGRQAAVFWPATPLAPAATYTVSLRIDDANGPGQSLERQWQFRTNHDAIKSMSYQVPTNTGKALLFRYPHIQSHHPRTAKVIWATSAPGQAALRIRPNGRETWLTLRAHSEEFRPEVTGLPAAFYQHEANVDGLEAGTAYHYQLLHDGDEIVTEVPLRTLPESHGATVQFVAFGDSGTPYSEPRAVRDAILSRTPDGRERYPHDFVAGLGDIAYYNGTYAEFNNNFFDQLSGKIDRGHGERSLLATQPFVAVLGNHEYGNNENATPHGFLDSFVNPVMEGIPAEDAERYYSFDAGTAHFVVLDSMKFQRSDTRGQKEMLHWLEQDIAATDRKWRIVFFHHAIFSHGPHGTYGDIGQNRTMRQRLAPILQRYGIQLVVFGHDHLYERSKRLQVDSRGQIMRDSKCQIVDSSKGIVYLTVGIGGAYLHNREVDPARCGTDGYDQAVREYGEGYDFVAMRGSEPVLYDSTDRPPHLPAERHGFIHAIVTPEQLTVTAYNIQHEVLDRFELTE